MICPPRGRTGDGDEQEIQPQRQRCSGARSCFQPQLKPRLSQDVLPPQAVNTCHEGDQAKQHDAATCLTGGSSTFAIYQFHLQRSVLGSRLLTDSEQVLGTRPRANPVKLSRSRLWPPGQSNQNNKFGSKEKGMLPSNLAT